MAVLREEEVTIRTLDTPETYRPLPVELRSVYKKVAASNGIPVIYAGYRPDADHWTLDIPGIQETFRIDGRILNSISGLSSDFIVQELTRWVHRNLGIPGVENRPPLTIGEATRRITDHMEHCITCSVHATCDDRQRLEAEADQIEALQEVAEVTHLLRSKGSGNPHL